MEPDKKPNLFRVGILFLFLAIMFYFMARVIFLSFAGYSGLEKMLAILFFLAELFVMIHAVGYFSNILRLHKSVSQPTVPQSLPLKEFPAVALLIPSRHEPKPVLESTVASCFNLDYPNKTVYLLDDSSDEKFKEEADEIAAKYGIKIFRRQERHGAKAGVINDCAKSLQDKYIAVFDVDQNPMPSFLKKIVPLLEASPKLALVQTPQFYTNLQAGKVSFASQMQQSVFYEYICEGKSTNQSMICCGTNVVLRREALQAVGGLDESSVTEDFATSFKLHTKGWETLYYNRVNTFGMGPEDLGAYFMQQNRWALGNVGMLRKIMTNFLKHPKRLGLDQWFEYVITSSYYLIGWSYLFLILCPIVYLFFSVPSFFMHPEVYAFTFFPYLFLSLAIFYTTMGIRRYTVGQMMKGQALLFITLPVFMRASFLGLMGKKGTFQVTAKGGGTRIAYRKLWPQLLIWALSLIAITWGLNRSFYEPTGAVFINMLWVFYHFLLISMVFYFNE